MRRIAVIGHSMGNGTVTDGTWSGAAVQGGWTLRTAGANAANYPTGNSPGQGMLPYLVEEAIAQGAVSGDRYIIRRATNGATLGSTTDANIAGLRDDVAALGVGDPDVICVWLGANDAQDTTERDQYTASTGLERVVRLLREEFPDSVILLMGERTSDSGQYPHIADGTIEAEKQSLAAAFPYVRYVDPTSVDLADAIHPSAAGYATMADRAAAVWRGP